MYVQSSNCYYSIATEDVSIALKSVSVIVMMYTDTKVLE